MEGQIHRNAPVPIAFGTLCVLQPDFLQLSARLFLPVLHQQNCISLFFLYYNANRLAVKAGGFASEREDSQPRVEQRGLVSVCQHSYAEMSDASANSSAGRCSRKTAIPPQKQATQCPEGSGEGRGEGGSLPSLCSPSASWSSMAFTRKPWK